MKTKMFIAAIFLLVIAVARAQTVIPAPVTTLPPVPPTAGLATNDLNFALQRGLFEEEGNRDLGAAISAYRSLAAQFDKSRQVAATAIFRLGECYRKLGRTNEAVAQYDRIVREFSDQQTLAALSRQNLAGLKPASPLSVAGNTFTDRLKEMIAKTTAPVQSVTDDEEKEIHRIQTMIQDSPDLINSGLGGFTLLLNAASAGQLRVVTFLLDHGANINLKSGGDAPLHGATSSGNKAMVELLLTRGADANATSGTGGTALHIAAESGFRSVAEVLLAHHADVNARNSEMNGECTPLHQAVSRGNVEIAKLLIDHGADLNAKSKNGSTPLSDAVGSTQVDSIKALLAANADPNVVDNAGRTPLSYAANGNNLETVKLLLDAKADPNAGKLDAPLLCAIERQNVESAELLLKAGANQNAISENDWNGGLFERRFHNPDSGKRTSATPLWLAVRKNQLAPVKLLLQFKADPNDIQTDGQAILFQALQNPEILTALLDAGGKIESRLAGENVPLLTAASWGKTPNPAVVELLLKRGANPNATDDRGRTALHYVAEGLGPREVFELLLAGHADPNVQDKSGQTPLDLLKQILRTAMPPYQITLIPDLADLLRQHGALDDLPKLDRIQVRRPSANFSDAVLWKARTNDWNHFTLLDTIANFYQITGMLAGSRNQDNFLPFADLSRIVVVHHGPGGKESRRQINLLSGSNRIDCTKDVLLEFGDVVEIPERLHSLNQSNRGLTDEEKQGITECLTGSIQLIAGDRKGELSIFPVPRSCLIGSVLGGSDARKILFSSSDLSRMKVTRRDSTGKAREWILDCSNPSSLPDLLLRDGDVVEVPEK